MLQLLDHSLPHYSGYSFRSRYIVRGLAERGIGVEVLTSARHDDFTALREVVDGIPHHRTPRPKGFLESIEARVPFLRERPMTAAMTRRLIEVARDFRPDLIHAHSPFFDGRAALSAGRRLGLPVVYEIRAFWEDDAVDKGKIPEDGFVYRQVRRLETKVVREADAVVCICEGLRADLVARGIPPEKIVVVKNGVELETFEPRRKPEALAARLGVAGRKVLGFIGSFFFYEGLPELVDCAAALARERSDFAVVLVGSGEDEANVKDRVRELGLEKVVKLAGRVPHEEIQDHYALMDFLVYPRRSKRLTEKVTPLKPLEAMAMERCCLGSDVGGIRELFEECGVGRTWKAGDAGAMARALREALDRDPAGREREGRAGRDAVRAKRTWKAALSPVADLYARLAARAPTPQLEALRA